MRSKSARLKDLLGGLMLGIIACLILIACGSDSNNAGQAAPQTTAVNNNSGANVSQGNSVGSGNTQAGGAVAINQPAQQLNPTGNLSQDIRNVIKATRPAVVMIVAQNAKTGSDFGGIFGRNGQQQVEQGIGTGSIITQDGYILTNNHVVEGFNQFNVVFPPPDNRRYNGRLIGREGRNNDMAIVKIDPKPGETFPTIPLGDSSKLELGEQVVAIGNALGLPGGPTVTSGIVGAIGRSIQEPNGAQLTQMLQTDAAINPGNSGGPLLNMRGEIIGMNTAAPVDQSSGGAAQGIGLAININQLKPLVDQFVKGGTGGQQQVAERPFMGILPQSMTAGLAARYQLPVDYGALVSRVDPNTPAANAGWQAGDIIVKMDNKDIRTLEDLSAVLATHKAGDKVNVTLVNRNGQQREAPITFGRAPAQN